MIEQLLGWAIALVLVVIVGRWLIAWSRSETDAGEASRITGRWFQMLVGGVIGALASLLVGVGDVLDIVVQFVGDAAFGVGVGSILGLGWATITGWIPLTGSQFLGVGIAIAAAVLIIREGG